MRTDEGAAAAEGADSTRSDGNQNGRWVVAGILVSALWLALLGTMFAYNTRFVVHIEELNQRVQELERRAGIEPGSLPRRER